MIFGNKLSPLNAELANQIFFLVAAIFGIILEVILLIIVLDLIYIRIPNTL